MGKNLNLIWIITGIIVGYVIVVIGSSLTWYLLPAHGSYFSSKAWELLVGNLAIAVFSFLASLIANSISKRKNYLASISISLIILLETIWFIKTQPDKDPVWYLILNMTVIIVGLLLGSIAGSYSKLNT